jgi:hypothetical protein
MISLKDSNIWAIVVLIVTTIIGPIIVWNFQQGKIENLKINIESEKLQLEKNKQLVEMLEKLDSLLGQQRIYYDEYTNLVQSGHKKGSFDLQRKKLQMEEKYQEIENIKKIISDITGKDIENIKGRLPPLPPSGFNVRIQ